MPEVQRVWQANMQVYGAYNALAKTINGFDEAEVIHRHGPWRTKQAVELATLEWLVQPPSADGALGYLPLAKFEANNHRQRAGQAATA